MDPFSRKNLKLLEGRASPVKFSWGADALQHFAQNEICQP